MDWTKGSGGEEQKDEKKNNRGEMKLLGGVRLINSPLRAVLSMRNGRSVFQAVVRRTGINDRMLR